MKPIRCLVSLLMLIFAVPLLHADQLDDLARDFWEWRVVEQPVSADDIPRIERPAGWLPDWSPAAVARYHQQLEQFEARWQKLDASAWPVSRQVDYRLIGSALARVRWELDFTRGWQRNPRFYIDQSLGAYFDLLLAPPPFHAERTRQIVAILDSIPRILEDGKKNLTQPAAPFARLAIAQLDGKLLRQSVQALNPFLNSNAAAGLDVAAEHAAAAVESYREWLNRGLPAMSAQTAVGREAYVFFLKNVALMPFTPEQLLAMGQQEWARSVASQTYEEHRNSSVPALAIFKDAAQQMAAEEKDEIAIRAYLESKNILTVPAWMQHYRQAPMPAYLAPWKAETFIYVHRNTWPVMRANLWLRECAWLVVVADLHPNISAS